MFDSQNFSQNSHFSLLLVNFITISFRFYSDFIDLMDTQYSN